MTCRQPRIRANKQIKTSPAMKSSQLLLAAAAFASLASLSFAGPGPEYWARMNQNQKPASYPSIWRTKAPAEAAVKAQPAAKTAGAVAASCATCECCAKKV
jgi:hypothetical protein